MEYNDLTEELKTKAKACATPEELAALAQEEGVELADAQLEAVSGGWSSGTPKCEKPYYDCPTLEGNPR